MDDIISVNYLESIDDLFHVEPNLLFCKPLARPPFLIYNLRQIFFLTKFHNYSDLIIKSVKLFVLNNIVTLASTQEANLVMDNFEKYFFVSVQYFNGNIFFFMYFRIKLP